MSQRGSRTRRARPRPATLPELGRGGFPCGSLPGHSLIQGPRQFYVPSAPSRRVSTGASLLDPVLALRRDLVPCGLSVWCELDETRVSAEPLETPQLASSSSH